MIDGKIHIAIMQPYFFPYIGYWQLINAVDVFVIYDDGRMITNGWIHRNRILDFDGRTPREIRVSLKRKSVSHTIGTMERAQNNRLMKKIVETIRFRYSRAPHYGEVMPLLEQLILNKETNLVRYITHSLQAICNYLGITTRFVISSTIDKTGCEGVVDKVERICKTLGITDYVNPIGGTAFYSKDDWARRGLKLNFLHRRDSIRYEQFGGEFVPDLSIIDMLMFCSKKEIQQILNEYDIL